MPNIHRLDTVPVANLLRLPLDKNTKGVSTRLWELNNELGIYPLISETFEALAAAGGAPEIAIYAHKLLIGPRQEIDTFEPISFARGEIQATGAHRAIYHSTGINVFDRPLVNEFKKGPDMKLLARALRQANIVVSGLVPISEANEWMKHNQDLQADIMKGLVGGDTFVHAQKALNLIRKKCDYFVIRWLSESIQNIANKPSIITDDGYDPQMAYVARCSSLALKITPYAHHASMLEELEKQVKQFIPVLQGQDEYMGVAWDAVTNTWIPLSTSPSSLNRAEMGLDEAHIALLQEDVYGARDALQRTLNAVPSIIIPTHAKEVLGIS